MRSGLAVAIHGTTNEKSRCLSVSVGSGLLTGEEKRVNDCPVLTFLLVERAGTEGDEGNKVRSTE
jgi:hypothetical protein